MLIVTLICCGAAAACLIIWDGLVRRHRVDTLAKSRITGPRTLPVIGNGLQLINVGAEGVLQYVGDCFQQYGKTFRIWLLNELQIYTTDTKYFESILSSTTLLQKGDLYDLFRLWLNDGLLLSVGQKWHVRRKLFTPAFHFKVLEHYVTVFDEQSSIMARNLAKCADGRTTIDLFPVVCLAALDVITEAAMGVKVNAQLDSNFPYVTALKSVVYIQPNRVMKLSQRYDWLFKLTSPRVYLQMVRNVKIMHDFTIRVIEERRATLKRTIADGTYKPLDIGDNDIGAKGQMALLDILLQSTINGKSLSNEDIREEVDTFMFEGDDTTTSGISHALYCIARHPVVQRKLCEEIRLVIGSDKDTPVTMKHLQQMRYMECVIKETLRLYPPVPAFGRRTDKDIEIDGAVIPANTSIYMIPYWAHRDPANFTDPETFNPDRFADTDVDGDAIVDPESRPDASNSNSNPKRNPYAYTPFSAGPKNCIGQKFAILEMKAMISKMLRYYELLPLGPDITPMFNFILRSQVGVKIGLKPRQQQH